MKSLLPFFALLFCYNASAQSVINYSFDYEIEYKSNVTEDNIHVILNTKDLSYFAIRDSDSDFEIYDFKKKKEYYVWDSESFREQDGVNIISDYSDRTSIDVVKNGNEYSITSVSTYSNGKTSSKEYQVKVDPTGVDLAGILSSVYQDPRLNSIKGELLELNVRDEVFLSKVKSYPINQHYEVTRDNTPEIEDIEEINVIGIPEFDNPKAKEFAIKLMTISQDAYKENVSRIDARKVIDQKTVDEFIQLDKELDLNDKARLYQYLESFPFTLEGTNYRTYHINLLGRDFDDRSLQEFWNAYANVSIGEIHQKYPYITPEEYIRKFEPLRDNLKNTILHDFPNLSFKDKNLLTLKLYSAPSDWSELILSIQKKL